MSGQVATCPYENTVLINLEADKLKVEIVFTIELITVFGLSAFDLLRCRRQPKHSEGSFKSAARCPKTRPPGREGTKAKDETIGK